MCQNSDIDLQIDNQADRIMVSTTSTAAAKGNTVQAQQELLETLVGIVTKYANEHMADVTNRMVAAMLDSSDDSLTANAVYLRVKAGNLLKSNSYAFFHLVAKTLEAGLQAEIRELLPSATKKLKAPITKLSLVPLEEMDSKVAFNNISRPFEIDHSEALATLNVRLAHMLDRDILRIGQNPFRPDVFLKAFHDAWCEFQPEQECHVLILPLLRPKTLFDMEPLLESLNQGLMRKGVLPGSVDSLKIRKTENANAVKKARDSNKAHLADQLRAFLNGDNNALANELGIDIPLIPDMPNLPMGKGGWRPSAGEGQPLMASAAQNGGGAHGHSGGGAPFLGHAQQGGGAPFLGHAQQGGGAPFVGHAQQGGGAPFVGHAQQGGGAPFLGHAPAGGGAPFLGQGGGGVPAQYATAAASSAALMDYITKFQASLPANFGTGGGAPFMGGMDAGAGMGGMMGMGMGDAGAMAGGSGDAALGPNVFYLPRLKASMPSGSLSRGDESTIDLLTRIFETVQLDDNIPKETRDLIQFLQIPVLKAALLDKNFFYQEEHPARRMIDLMSRMGLEQRQGTDDPLFQAMQRSVDRVGRDSSQHLNVFEEAVAELEETIKEEEKVAAAAIQEPIAQALKQEKRTAATRSAKSAVAVRLGKGEVIAVVETFLEKKWTSVLTVAYQVEEEKPGAVGNATKTMDDLIWSVRPKITQEQKKDLIAKLPGLLATLNRWLDVIKWQDADRLQFFAELAECHASIVRAPIEMSPDRQLEIAVEVAQQDAIRRIEKENEVSAVDEAEADEFELTVDGLERGMWLEFTQSDASVRKVKLSWISPLRTLYIFSTGTRQEAFSMSTEKLTEGFRAGKVKALLLDGVVSRALHEAMENSGAVNDPAMDLPRTAFA